MGLASGVDADVDGVDVGADAVADVVIVVVDIVGVDVVEIGTMGVAFGRVERVVVDAGVAVGVRTGAVDVSVAFINVEGGAAVDDDAVVGATVVVDAVGVVESGAITAVAVVVVEVVTVTCCDSISDDPIIARFAASRAAAGDMGVLLLVVVVVIELAHVVDLIRASPRCMDSGPVAFEPPDGTGVFAFVFICICDNVSLNDCCCFFPLSIDFLDLLVLDAAVGVEPTRTIIGSCSASSSPSFLSASSSL